MVDLVGAPGSVAWFYVNGECDGYEIECSGCTDVSSFAQTSQLYLNHSRGVRAPEFNTRWVYQEGSLVGRPNGTASSSSYSLKEDPSEPESDIGRVAELKGLAPADAESMGTYVAGQQIAELRREVARMNGLFYMDRQVCQQETAGADRRSFTQFLSTARDSMDGARVELEF
ncbi:hypothetical protein M9H77_07800 [Catharanthus roseus]|uniref:Uncharacterized protein n=1 Tax=Catharanthus roseus TaxID=4058 RepID=A0ACC0BVY6_CATRO|nr:hypothetical protein M9H77_07800 [Catharanthus roseus]